LGLLIAVDGAAAAMLLYGLLQQLGEWVAADGSR
jgi:hypothetical protein